MPTANLPLLQPLRWIPVLGDPLANLLQPFLRPIVDFGYGNTFLMPGLGGVGQGVGNAIADPLIAGLPPVGLPALSSAV